MGLCAPEAVNDRTKLELRDALVTARSLCWPPATVWQKVLRPDVPIKPAAAQLALQPFAAERDRGRWLRARIASVAAPSRRRLQPLRPAQIPTNASSVGPKPRGGTPETARPAFACKPHVRAIRTTHSALRLRGRALLGRRERRRWPQRGYSLEHGERRHPSPKEEHFRRILLCAMAVPCPFGPPFCVCPLRSPRLAPGIGLILLLTRHSSLDIDLASFLGPRRSALLAASPEAHLRLLLHRIRRAKTLAGAVLLRSGSSRQTSIVCALPLAVRLLAAFAAYPAVGPRFCSRDPAQLWRNTWDP